MRKAIIHLVLFCLYTIIVFPAQARQHNLPVVDIDQLQLMQSLVKHSGLAFIGPDESLADRFQHLSFQPLQQHSRTVTGNQVTTKAVLVFRVGNAGDSARSTWFFPGLYYTDIRLFQLSGNVLKPIPSVLPQYPKEVSYRLLTIPANDTMTVVAELRFVRTYLNRLMPRFVSAAYLSSYVNELANTNIESKTVTFLFCGLLLMMILFSLSSFLQGGNKEFLYYALYALALAIMLFIKAIYSYRTNTFGFFNEAYLDFILQSAGHLFYMAFMQRYLSASRTHPFLYRFYNAGIVMLSLTMLLFTYLHYFTYNFILEYWVENISKILLLVMVVIFLIYSMRHWQDKLLRFLFWGNLLLLVFSGVSLLFVWRVISFPHWPEILSTGLFYYEMGLLFELIFFMAGLYYKNRKQLVEQARERERLKAENLMKEYEKELAVYKAQQQERERISADMHDELGSGMTAIRLMSEIAKNKMKENIPAEIDKISRSADEVLNKMNAIIWSMDSSSDTVDNLVAYIRAFALEYFENTPIICKVQVPAQNGKQELSGDKRRNLFLCVKETLTNTLKHSKANAVSIAFASDEKYLTIKISDNGTGADLQKIRQYGNGLKNIGNRMKSIGGFFEISNSSGTQTTLRVLL